MLERSLREEEQLCRGRRRGASATVLNNARTESADFPRRLETVTEIAFAGCTRHWQRINVLCSGAGDRLDGSRANPTGAADASLHVGTVTRREPEIPQHQADLALQTSGEATRPLRSENMLSQFGRKSRCWDCEVWT